MCDRSWDKDADLRFMNLFRAMTSLHIPLLFLCVLSQYSGGWSAVVSVGRSWPSQLLPSLPINQPIPPFLTIWTCIAEKSINRWCVGLTGGVGPSAYRRHHNSASAVTPGRMGGFVRWPCALGSLRSLGALWTSKV